MKTLALIAFLMAMLVVMSDTFAHRHLVRTRSGHLLQRRDAGVIIRRRRSLATTGRGRRHLGLKSFSKGVSKGVSSATKSVSKGVSSTVKAVDKAGGFFCISSFTLSLPVLFLLLSPPLPSSPLLSPSLPSSPLLSSLLSPRPLSDPLTLLLSSCGAGKEGCG